nr:DNA polymerase III subunit delta' [Lysobacter sp. CAU 1642]
MSEALEGGRLGHGLLLAGAGELGQSDLAERLAARLLCEAPAEGLACGSCRGCRLRLAGTHPDLRRIGLLERDDGRLKTEIGVEQIRQLSHWFSLTPQFGRGLVALISPADLLNMAAANAVLKTLEEPAPDRYLLLVCSQLQRLPATVRSRCQKWILQPPAAEVSRQWLQGEGIAARDAAQALEWAAGQPVAALELARDGGLALFREVSEQLDALATGRIGPSELGRIWAGDQPEQRLRAAVAEVARRGWSGEGLTVAGDFTKLAAWSRQADRARALYAVPLRHEMLLVELLQGWRSLHRGRTA